MHNFTGGHAPTTPEQEFARARLRELHERAVDAIERRWRAKGPQWSERFDVILSLLYAKEADTTRACERLGIKDGNLRILKRRLRLAIDGHMRAQIREDLRLDANMDRAIIERRVDQEVRDLLHTAYPGGDAPYLFWNEDDDDDLEVDPDPDPDHPGQQPEAT